MLYNLLKFLDIYIHFPELFQIFAPYNLVLLSKLAIELFVYIKSSI